MLPGRLISRTSPFEGERGGASPSPAATPFHIADFILQTQFRSDQFAIYNLKSAIIWPVSSKSERQSYKLRTLESYLHGLPILPLSVEVCTPVSETGRAGALPVAAANLVSTKNKHQEDRGDWSSHGVVLEQAVNGSQPNHSRRPFPSLHRSSTPILQHSNLRICGKKFPVTHHPITPPLQYSITPFPGSLRKVAEGCRRL